MRLTTKLLFKLAPLWIGAIVVAGTLIFYNLNSAFVYDELVNLNLIPQPEKLTELYFKDPANLPRAATNNEEISFAFVIHNLEATDYQYAYVVSLSANGAKRVIDSRNVLVKNNQYYVQTEKFTLFDSPGRQEILVELISKRQSIRFRTGEP